MRSIGSLLAVAGAIAILAPANADAQGIGERLKQRVQQRVDERTDAAVERVVDKAENGITCKVTDSACIEKAQKSGGEVVVTDERGAPLPDRDQPDRSNRWGRAPGRTSISRPANGSCSAMTSAATGNLRVSLDENSAGRC
jgi:hypothetical protein